MAAIAWSDVVAANPAAANVSATTQQDILNWVNQALNTDLYDGEDGVTTRLSRVYLAAHLAQLGVENAAGPLTGQGALGLSRTYGQPLSKSELATTAFGLAFMRLLPSTVRVGFVL